jgi:predicted nucleic acid-binding protein
VAFLVDTNILIYRVDPRDPRKRDIARDFLRRGAQSGELRISHQSLVEFVNATTRSRGNASAILSWEDAARQTEFFMAQFTVLYPDENIVRLALRASGVYRLSWFDAHLWAYAEHNGLSELISENFEHGRMYGKVKIRNPFLEAGLF